MFNNMGKFTEIIGHLWFLATSVGSFVLLVAGIFAAGKGVIFLADIIGNLI